MKLLKMFNIFCEAQEWSIWKVLWIQIRRKENRTWHTIKIMRSDNGRSQKLILTLDYDDTFAHVSLYTTIICVLSFVAYFNWSLHQMDMKEAFLNGRECSLIEWCSIGRSLYTKTTGIGVVSQEDIVCKLLKSLYGLKEAPHVRYTLIDEWLHKKGVQMSSTDANLYFLCDGSSIVMVVALW